MSLVRNLIDFLLRRIYALIVAYLLPGRCRYMDKCTVGGVNGFLGIIKDLFGLINDKQCKGIIILSIKQY